MIQISINNKQTLEIIQDLKKDGIVVTRKDSDGTVNNRYIIEYGDMVMLLNYYLYCKENNKEIF